MPYIYIIYIYREREREREIEQIKEKKCSWEVLLLGEEAGYAVQ